MNKRDLRPSYDFLASMANRSEREQCPDTIHEIAIHNTERAIAAEKKLERIAEYCMDGYENPELYYDGAFTMHSEEGCTCQRCGKKYKVDFLVPDELWEEIKPAHKAVGAGLLCGMCITKAIEDKGEFGAYKVIEI